MTIELKIPKVPKWVTRQYSLVRKEFKDWNIENPSDFTSKVSIFSGVGGSFLAMYYVADNWRSRDGNIASKYGIMGLWGVLGGAGGFIAGMCWPLTLPMTVGAITIEKLV
jgi:hypothetical protein